MTSPTSAQPVSARLALGSAQFGMRYGVANRAGPVSDAELSAILECARAAGVRTLDTAIQYGESEERLGRAGMGQWQVISKLPPIESLTRRPERVGEETARAVHGSLRRLGIAMLHGVLLHRPQDLLSPLGAALYEALLALKREGLVARIGISVYGPEEIEELPAAFRFDIIQAPFNVVDRRLSASGWLDRLRTAGVEVHVRSAFLQGLLLMREAERPGYFARWSPLWRCWHDWLAENELTALQACLSFVLSYPVDRVVVGVDGVAQLQAIVAQTGQSLPPPASLASIDPELINPSRWNLT